VVILTAPPDCVKLTLLPKPLPDERDTSKLVGAVIRIFAVRSVPETVKFWSAEGVPTVVEKEVKLAE
jgi:hypothetical protein